MLKEYKTILLDEVDSVAILKLNRPEKLNAFNMQMFDDMLDAIDFVNNNDNIKSLVITGLVELFVQEQTYLLERKLLIKNLILKDNLNPTIGEMLEVY